VYILLECCTGRTLADLLRSKTRLTDAEAADLLLQTITAIKMLHDQRIIHRDLKLSNLFLDKAGKVKVRCSSKVSLAFTMPHSSLSIGVSVNWTGKLSGLAVGRWATLG